ARYDLFRCKRLDDIVIGAGIQALDAVLDAVAGRQHEHGQPATCATNGFDQLQTVAVGQSKIEDHRIIGNALDMSGGVIKACSLVNGEAALLKGCAHVPPQVVIVLNNKYPHAELLFSSPKATLMECL